MLGCWIQAGLSGVTIAVEPGRVVQGAAQFCKIVPQLILGCEGVVSYFIQRNGIETEIRLHKGDLLIVAEGAWLGLAPRRPYQTLGIIMDTEMTHSYLACPKTAPSTPGRSMHLFMLPIPWHGFTCIEHPVVHDTRAVPETEVTSLVDTLARASRRPANDPFMITLGVLLLRELRRILAMRGAPASSKAHATYLAACAGISRNFDRSINRESVASELRIHPQHLSRLFSRFTGRTFSQYLLEFRLKKAAVLLEGKGRTVAEVAAACGFGSDAYFVRCFRRHYGHTPGAH